MVRKNGHKLLFAKCMDFDSKIRQRFSAIHQQAPSCELWQWRRSAEGCLAGLIMLDRFSRNLFRHKPESLAFDALALATAQSAVTARLDRQVPSEQRAFFYIPYTQSESDSVHDKALRLFSDLCIESQLGFEFRHKAIIDQFDRYPHRNTTLNRPSTAADLASLRQPKSLF